MILRGDELILSGTPESVERAAPVARWMIERARTRRPFSVSDVERFFERDCALLEALGQGRAFDQLKNQAADAVGFHYERADVHVGVAVTGGTTLHAHESCPHVLPPAAVDAYRSPAVGLPVECARRIDVAERLRPDQQQREETIPQASRVGLFGQELFQSISFSPQDGFVLPPRREPV
ncbi:hypothetical protein LCGC14_3028160, partial [marine sediment metagenome]